MQFSNCYELTIFYSMGRQVSIRKPRNEKRKKHTE